MDRAVSLETGVRRLNLQALRAATLAQKGEHREAAAAAAALDTGSSDANLIYDLACVYSLCASAALRDRRPSPSVQPNSLSEGYAMSALGLLHRADKEGYFADTRRLKNFRQDPDLDSLRGREDFKEFLERVERQSRKNSASPP
jgi:hypothetical protein